jgi:hypothetical protein
MAADEVPAVTNDVIVLRLSRTRIKALLTIDWHITNTKDVLRNTDRDTGTARQVHRNRIMCYYVAAKTFCRDITLFLSSPFQTEDFSSQVN